ncbi:MAG: hypothetical protein V9E88_16735 [Ferruginibacter sp.]
MPCKAGRILFRLKKRSQYINALLKVGFDTIDFGSFVSPKAIPQMADTKEVLKGLDLTGSPQQITGHCCQ